jgi:hypothetical protein
MIQSQHNASFLFLLSFLVLPELAVEWTNDTHYDFGDLPYGKAVQYEFPFKNVGDEALVIDNVRASCGCTLTDWPQDPIAPDSTGVILVDYDAKDKAYFYKKIKVYFQGIRKAEILTIEGDIVE